MEPKVLEPKTTGDRIRIVREIFGLNQVEFAKRLCVTNAHISKLEKRDVKPSGALMKLICMEFRISADWLEKGEGPMYAGRKVNMDAVCVKHGKQPDREEFKRIAKPLVEWLQKNGCPHDRIIVEYSGAEFVSGEIAFSVEVPD